MCLFCGSNLKLDKFKNFGIIYWLRSRSMLVYHSFVHIVYKYFFKHKKNRIQQYHQLLLRT